MRLSIDQNELTVGRLTLTAGALFVLALLFYTGCGPVLSACFAAAGLHELGHLLLCWLLGVPVRRLRISMVGAELDLGGRCRSGMEECLVALAGPAANLGTGLAALRGGGSGEDTYLFVGASVMLALFNLLPVLPLDGSRVLHGGLSAALPLEQADRLVEGISQLTGIALLIPGVCFALRGNGSLLLLILWLALFRREKHWGSPAERLPVK